jgi:hypothetical protein
MNSAPSSVSVMLPSCVLPSWLQVYRRAVPSKDFVQSLRVTLSPSGSSHSSAVPSHFVPVSSESVGMGRSWGLVSKAMGGSGQRARRRSARREPEGVRIGAGARTRAGDQLVLDADVTLQ